MKRIRIGVFNAVDIIIILALLAAAAAAVFLLRGAAGETKNATVYFTVEIDDVEPGFGSKIEPGSEVRDSVKGFYLGTVHSVEEKASVRNIYIEEEGVYARVEVPGRSAVLLTVRAEGTESDSVITAEGQAVRMGLEMYVKGKGYAGIGYVVELRAESK